MWYLWAPLSAQGPSILDQNRQLIILSFKYKAPYKLSNYSSSLNPLYFVRYCHVVVVEMFLQKISLSFQVRLISALDACELLKEINICLTNYNSAFVWHEHNKSYLALSLFLCSDSFQSFSTSTCLEMPISPMFYEQIFVEKCFAKLSGA